MLTINKILNINMAKGTKIVEKTKKLQPLNNGLSQVTKEQERSEKIIF